MNFRDDADKFRMQAVDNLTTGKTDLHGIVRDCLSRDGTCPRDRIGCMDGGELASHAIRMAGMGSSDLPAILADVAEKEFRGGFEGEPSTFQEIVSEVEAQNFLPKSMTKLSSFSDMEEIPEGMAFKEGKYSDKKESIQLSTYGKAFTYTRQLFVNNDTQALKAFNTGMGAAMRRRQNRDFYDLLTYNTLVGPLTTEDGVAVFNDASHGNLKASSGVPSVASLGVADQKLMEQKGLKSSPDQGDVFSNLSGTLMLAGTSNRMTCLQLFGSVNDPAATDGKLVYNPYKNPITPVFDAYLQSKLTTAGFPYAWYWFAGPKIFRNFVVCYLSGSKFPTIRTAASAVGQPLGISMDIFFDYKFGIEDYRGVIFNDGASA